MIANGPLMVRGVPMFVAQWDPLKGLTKPVHNTCPLWVKLHNVPLVAFNKEGISRIASALGVPKQMDACTASMCDKAWGRPGFAKVLIEVWAVGDLKREIELVIPNPSGGVESTVTIKVEYIWEPSQCSHCVVFGHKLSSCAKAVAVQHKTKKLDKMDSDGFVTIERRQWKPKVVDKPSSSGVSKEEGKTVGYSKVTNINTQQEEVPVVEVEEEGAPASSSKPLEGSDGQLNVETADEASEVPEFTLPTNTEFVRTSRGYQRIPAGGDSRNKFSPLASLDDPGPVPGTLVDSGKKDKGSVEKSNSGNKKSRGVSKDSKGESHLSSVSLGSVVSSVFGRWSWISNQSICLHGTRVILAWNSAVMDVMVIEAHVQFIHCEIRMRGDPQPWFCSVVYGANNSVLRRQLWSGLRKFRAIMGNQPWVVMGDFNAMLFPHDALGGMSRRNSDMIDFFECVEDIEVFDISYTGIQHTWCQKPKEEAGLRRKLDRILSNVEFTDRFQDVHARFFPRGISDHSPGVFGFKGGKRKRKMGFKFENFLVDHPSFIETVKRGWDVPVEGTFMYRVTTRLKALKEPLRKLRRSYGNLSSKANDLKEELNVIQLACDLDPFNEDLREDLQAIRLAYQKVCSDENEALRQRAKVHWLREGDSNTRFFHNVVRERRHINQVRSVCNSEGVFVYDEDVPSAFIDHLKGYMGTCDDSVDPVIPTECFQNKLSLADALFMIRPILDSEIRDAMFQIGKDKAPGSDGFTSKFFKAAWEVIGSDITIAIHNFFYRGHLAKELNHTLICLLPKTPNATSVTDFRPISCCSVLYKCISKIIVNRMKSCLDGLVDRSQSAFIPGRRIVDNILMAHELVIGYHLNTGKPRCAFKIDLRKAYDMVDWRFLINMLEGLGFHPVMVSWIKEMVSTTTYSIAVNGESWGYFHGKRGIRQGDPLSPYLFTLVMEGFAMTFKQCIMEASRFEHHPGCSDIELTHLCFADDLFVFTGGDVASVEVLKRALFLFQKRAGLSPNLAKSDVFFGNVSDSTKDAILACLPFRMGTFPIRYLGVPLSPVFLKVADYGGLVSRVKQRVQNWKMKNLSFGGRKQLIISVLQSIQLYWMAIYVFPSSVVHELEGILRAFLWAQGGVVQGKCRIAWSDVCRPKDCGGLGFKRLSIWNRALIAKNIWDILVARPTLWVTWLRGLNVHAANFWVIRKSNAWFWVLRKMMELRDVLRPHIKVIIGDGRNTHAWEDTWLDCGPLVSLITYRRIHSQGFNASTTVRDFIDICDGSWPPDWVNRIPNLLSQPLPLVEDGVADVVRWQTRQHGVGQFSVREAYNSLDLHYDRLNWTKSVWFVGHIPKHALLVQILLYPRSQDEEIILKSKKVKQSQMMEVKEESQASKSKKEALMRVRRISRRVGASVSSCQRVRSEKQSASERVLRRVKGASVNKRRCELSSQEQLTMDSDITKLQTAAVDAYVNDLLNPIFFESIYQRVDRFTNIIWKLKKENISLTDQVVTHEKSTSSQQAALIIKVTNLEDSLSKERSLITSLKKDLQNEHDQMLKHSFGNAQNLKLVTSLRKENECLQKKVIELDEDKKIFENNLISSQSRVMELSKQVTDFEQIVIIERSNFEKERKVFEEERNVFVNERKSFELESEKLSQKISDLERKFLIDRKEFERQMKNSLKKPSLRAGKYQNMMHEFEEEIQVVHLDKKVDDKKSIELQKQIVDLQNQLSDVRHQFKQKEKVLRHEKTILEQIIAEPTKPTLVEKDFADQKEAFKAEINKLTSKLSGLSTDIMNEQQMRSDQQKKLNDLLEERNKLSSKVKELEEIIFKAHDSSNVDSASRSHINSSGQIRTSNLFYDCHVDRSGIHRYSNGKFVWQVKGSSTKDIEVSMINPEPEDLPKKHIPRLDLVCEGVYEMNIETRHGPSVDNLCHPTKLLKYLLKDVCFNSHGELAYHLSNLHSEDLDIETRKTSSPVSELHILCTRVIDFQSVSQDSPNHHEGEKFYQRRMQRHDEDMGTMCKNRRSLKLKFILKSDLEYKGGDSCQLRLPTQDRLILWKQEPPDWKCSLCGVVMDSHQHLFFECPYSSNVWLQVKDAIGWRDAPQIWDEIMGALSGPTPPKKFIHKIGLAATMYMIWKERNRRLFTVDRLPDIVCAKKTIDIIMMRHAWRRMMKTRWPLYSVGPVYQVVTHEKSTSSQQAELIIKVTNLEDSLSKERSLITSLKKDLQNEHDQMLKHSFGNAQNLKLVTSLRKENECLQKKVIELDEDKKIFENNLISSQSRVMELSKQVTDFEQIVIIERSNFEKERKVFEEERNVFVNERKSFELESEKLSQKISDLERKFLIERKEFERQMKNSLKKPSLRAGKYQNMMHEFEEEIQVVHLDKKVDDKKSIELQKQIVDLQNQLSDVRHQFKQKEKVLRHEKTILEQIIAEPNKPTLVEKDFADQKEAFKAEINKLTSKLSGLSTDIMNEQQMRSDQQKKLNDLLEERNKLSTKVKELEEIIFKAHDSSTVDSASRSHINSSGQIRTSNLFYDRHVDRSGIHRYSNGKFVWQVKGSSTKDIEVSMINPEPEDLPKKHNPRLDLVCEGVNKMNIETRHGPSVDNLCHPTKLLKYLLKDVCFNSHGELAYHLSTLHSEDLDIELRKTSSPVSELHILCTRVIDFQSASQDSPNHHEGEKFHQRSFIKDVCEDDEDMGTMFRTNVPPMWLATTSERGVTLQSMQLYWLMIFVLPSAVTHELESCFRDFLWAQGDSSKGKCKISWDMICRPIACGGLGFKRLGVWNRAFIAKHVWDLLTHRNSLWVDWIWRYCIRQHSFWTLKPKQQWSWVFRKILDIRQSVRYFFVYQLGNGLRVNAWEDKWLEVGPLSGLISYRRFTSAEFDIHTTANDLLVTCNGAWPDMWVSLNPLAFSLPPPIISESVNMLKWRGIGGIGTDYSVKEAWRSLSGAYQPVLWMKFVWFKGHVPKHGFCMWTACHGRLPTQDRVGTWMHDSSDMRCPLCERCADSHDHLFLNGKPGNFIKKNERRKQPSQGASKTAGNRQKKTTYQTNKLATKTYKG
ncbi:hypothetical protein OSB04_028243 [Centaurea solstitialis]|uniref:Reverse transcriptase domain-containing protein n=1 Tax=Centaurea solstitialis TaxID=347529 RepID=A0AA38SYW1_9ASTR|nr:hypothetical protein OSB04_028243 [Centaurea solstitialis]